MTINFTEVIYFIGPPILQGIVTGLVITLMAKFGMFPAIAFMIKDEDV